MQQRRIRFIFRLDGNASTIVKTSTLIRKEEKNNSEVDSSYGLLAFRNLIIFIGLHQTFPISHTKSNFLTFYFLSNHFLAWTLIDASIWTSALFWILFFQKSGKLNFIARMEVKIWWVAFSYQFRFNSWEKLLFIS